MEIENIRESLEGSFQGYDALKYWDPYLFLPFREEFTPKLRKAVPGIVHHFYFYGSINDGDCSPDCTDPRPQASQLYVRLHTLTQEGWQKYGRLGDNVIGQFALSTLPGCGAVLVSHSSVVLPEFQGRGIGKLMQEMKVFLSRRMKASQLLATVVVGNEAEEHLLNKSGWKKLSHPLHSRRTGNTIQEWALDVE